MKRHLIISFLTAVFLVSAASFALAQPGGGCPGGIMANVPPEKREQVTKIFVEGHQKLFEMEGRKWSRQAELNTLLASPQPDSSKVEALAKEIGDLASQAYQERVALQLRILKETGVNLPLAGNSMMMRGPGGCMGMKDAPGCPGCPMAHGFQNKSQAPSTPNEAPKAQ